MTAKELVLEHRVEGAVGFVWQRDVKKTVGSASASFFGRPRDPALTFLGVAVWAAVDLSLGRRELLRSSGRASPSVSEQVEGRGEVDAIAIRDEPGSGGAGVQSAH